MARIVFSTIGTLGDLHPSLAIARELVARGHEAVIASHPEYRARVEAAGLAFRAAGPDFRELANAEQIMRLAMDEKGGSEYVVRKIVLPTVRATYDDLLVVCAGADAIVTHMLSFAGVVVAEKLGIPRIGQILQPISMLSAYDPPVGPLMPASSFVRQLGPGAWKVILWLARTTSRGWFREVDELRAAVGLPRSAAHPLFESASPLLNLALFPSVLAAPQPDWPPHTVVTGLCLYDRDEQGAGLPERVRAFLDGGEPPLVFTLGSSGVWDAAGFYDDAATAATALGRRAVLLVGPQPASVRAEWPAGVIAVDYAPHSELFARAAAIVHHGGIGTTGQALRAGKPMVIVPFSHDQPDNALRCERLGVSRTVPRGTMSAARLEAALRAVLEPTVAARAEAIGERVRADGGAPMAADAIEKVVGTCI